jgi:hypothetical protein
LGNGSRRDVPRSRPAGRRTRCVRSWPSKCPTTPLAAVVAVDGTKIAAAATHHATRGYEQIAREILEEAARIDAAEDALFGDDRGDELPEVCAPVGIAARSCARPSRRWTPSTPAGYPNRRPLPAPLQTFRDTLRAKQQWRYSILRYT